MPPVDTQSIELFVRGTLGCKCPREVFRSITISRERNPMTGDAYMRLVVGDRLLIYVLRAQHAKGLSPAVSALTNHGRIERDAGHLNRFRLVLATAHPSQVPADAQARFTTASGDDDRAHLHVIATDKLPPDLRQP